MIEMGAEALVCQREVDCGPAAPGDERQRNGHAMHRRAWTRHGVALEKDWEDERINRHEGERLQEEASLEKLYKLGLRSHIPCPMRYLNTPFLH